MISTGSALVAKNSSVRSSVARSTAVRLVSRLLLTSRRPCGRVVGSSSSACRKNASHTAARAAVWDAFFRQALELLPTTLPQGLREVSSSLLTSLTAVDLATLERTLEFLATSAEPVDITADALPGTWAGGHYTVSDASRAAVQSFFNLSPAAAQSASGSEP